MTKDYLTTVISPLLTKPEHLIIIESVDEKGRLFSIDVARNDMGRVIGKEGKNIEAIRTLVGAVSSFKEDSKVSIKVNEPK